SSVMRTTGSLISVSSDCLVSQINSNICRLTERSVLVRANTIISRLIPSDQGSWQPKKMHHREIPVAERQAQQGTRPHLLAKIATRLHSKQTLSPRRGCARIATHPSQKRTCFPSIDRHF
ncbi:hypothetical protein, partial [Burkholderia cenocepacia]